MKVTQLSKDEYKTIINKSQSEIWDNIRKEVESHKEKEGGRA